MGLGEWLGSGAGTASGMIVAGTAPRPQGTGEPDDPDSCEAQLSLLTLKILEELFLVEFTCTKQFVVWCDDHIFCEFIDRPILVSGCNTEKIQVGRYIHYFLGP